MSHIEPVQQEARVTRDVTSGIFRTGERSSFLAVGVLGSDAEFYSIPRTALMLLAQHLGGEISEDLPPFLVPCLDGMVLVMTLHQAGEFFGTAVLLTEERLARLDRGILELWARLVKDQAAEDFFKDTAFKIADCLAYLPAPIERGWKSAFC
jgi:hypothetical protein